GDGRTGEGLGLGLALAKGLVELHGGRLEAFSDGENAGSRFTVRLPLAEGANAPVRRSDDPASAAPNHRRSRRRVLIVEDNVDAAIALQQLLELQGHETRVVHDGAHAVAAAMVF